MNESNLFSFMGKYATLRNGIKSRPNPRKIDNGTNMLIRGCRNANARAEEKGCDEQGRDPRRSDEGRPDNMEGRACESEFP
ncbi:MAG: hypothetical protein ACI9VS_002007 [Candidatus Binatia bacterium]